MRSFIHNLLGKLWHWLGLLLRRTKHWDRTP